MTPDNWIDIVDFSKKYGVSQSTLRRRIRSGSIEYKLEKGKYYLVDSKESMLSSPLYSRKKLLQSAPSIHAAATLHQNPLASFSIKPQGLLMDDFMDQTELETLRNENKRLRSEISELQTLVKILEAQIGNE